MRAEIGESEESRIKETNSSSFLSFQTLQGERWILVEERLALSLRCHFMGVRKETQISSFHASPQCGWCGKMVLSRSGMTYRVAENRTGPVE